MRLTRLTIKQYKQLKNITLDGKDADGREDFPVYFCIGLNGSGKSTFLEAVALIFSRISQNELPGFWFELEYDIWCDGGTAHVAVSPLEEREKGRLRICVNGGPPFSSFEGMEKYLPYKVIACVSGQNGGMERLVNSSAEEALLSDVFDAAAGEDAGEIDNLLRSLNAAGTNPRILYLGENTVNLILFVLCAWKPEQSGDYEEKRSAIFRRISGGFRPRVVSVSAGDMPGSGLFGQFFHQSAETEETGLADWVSRDDEGMTAGMLVEGTEEACSVKRLCRKYSNPLQLLAVLLRAQHAGELRECHVQFQARGEETFLNEQALSDGELLWAARMGLVLFASREENSNCLFLFDEPDIHLNESWNVEFVSQLKRLSEREMGGRDTNSYWISTHSSLLLTDALPEHVYLFERGEEGISVRRVPVSLFGAGRPEISESVFENSAQIGEYAQEQIEAVIRDPDIRPEELSKFIDGMGAGFQRFRLLDKYYSMIRRTKE